MALGGVWGRSQGRSARPPLEHRHATRPTSASSRSRTSTGPTVAERGGPDRGATSMAMYGPMGSPDIRHVVIHTPGRAWQSGVEFREQPGVSEHVAHYRALLEQGRLELGGPYLDDAAGGMMIAAPGVDRAELESFAADDPAVRSGLLRYEIRTWLVAMSGDSDDEPEPAPG